jgi:hypothetical protein
LSDSDLLLQRIEDGIVAHGGDLGGWTRRDEGMVQLFDGRVTLTAYITEEQVHAQTVHAHVLTTLHEHDNEVLDACIMGFGDSRAGAIDQAAVVWITSVAGPIRSLLEGHPV